MGDFVNSWAFRCWLELFCMRKFFGIHFLREKSMNLARNLVFEGSFEGSLRITKKNYEFSLCLDIFMDFEPLKTASVSLICGNPWEKLADHTSVLIDKCQDAILYLLKSFEACWKPLMWTKSFTCRSLIS